MRICNCLSIYLLFLTLTIKSQQDSVTAINYKCRKITTAAVTTGFLSSSIVYLNNIWYKPYHNEKFHFFNDNKEWLQMDKVGHIYFTYQFSRLMTEGFEWSGFSKRQSLGLGGTMGFFYMGFIEIMDGYSRGWGFSWGDILANTLGTSLSISQNAAWEEQRLQLKFSFLPSGLAKYNPELLGKDFYTQLIKDYNSQTYWLSINPSCFMKKESKFPRYLSFSLGYSAFGMIGSNQKTYMIQNELGEYIQFEAQRRYFLSVDLDLSRIKTKSKLLKSVFSIFNTLKIPAPTLQYGNQKFKFYYLYY